jgi:hypothetical protein
LAWQVNVFLFADAQARVGPSSARLCSLTSEIGKSATAVQLGLRYHGEIINADALQLYKGSIRDLVERKLIFSKG